MSLLKDIHYLYIKCIWIFMSRQLSTDTAIRKWVISKNEETFSCGNRIGLYIRGYLSGRKVFYWRDNSWIKLGDYPEITLAEARDYAIICKRYKKVGKTLKEISAALSLSLNADEFDEILRNGTASSTMNTLLTYGAVFDEWYHKYEFRLWQDGASRRRPLAMHSKWVSAELKSKPIQAVERSDIFRLIEFMFNNVTDSAGKQLGYMNRVFEYGINAGYTNVNPCPPRSAFEVSPRKKVPHESLPYAELPRLWQWIGTRQFDKSTALAMRTVMLTGHRISVVTQAKWEHLDVQSGVWTIPPRASGDKETSGLMKSGRSFSVKFPQKFFEQLLAAKSNSGFIFPSPTTKGHISPNATLKAFKRFNSKITNHGFRNSIKIWGRHNKIPDYIMDAYADHSLKGLDASYRREDLSTELFKITENLYSFLERQ